MLRFEEAARGSDILLELGDRAGAGAQSQQLDPQVVRSDLNARALPRRPALAKNATTGASDITRAAFTVRSSGSPGPIPTP